MDKKLCVLFPGIGYHCDKPLLYYTEKLARSKGYETIKLQYSGFTPDADAALHALWLTGEQLSRVKLAQYDRIVFVGKSIGTAAALAYREKRGVKAECVLLTPLVQTFDFSAKDCTAFHGTADRWAATADIERLCAEKGVPLHKYEGANHSLECGDPAKDILTVADVIGKLGEIFR